MRAGRRVRLHLPAGEEPSGADPGAPRVPGAGGGGRGQADRTAPALLRAAREGRSPRSNLPGNPVVNEAVKRAARCGVSSPAVRFSRAPKHHVGYLLLPTLMISYLAAEDTFGSGGPTSLACAGAGTTPCGPPPGPGALMT